MMNQRPAAFWSVELFELFRGLDSTRNGLTEGEAKQRLVIYGRNRLKATHQSNTVTLLFAQFKSPIILILLFATILSFFLRDPIDAFIILAIVVVSGLLGFWQEHSASTAVAQLISIVQVKVSIRRDGSAKALPLEEIVPGDVVILKAGDIVPGDGLILDANALFIDEAMLTGETFPSEKVAAVLPPDTPLAQRTNAIWMGTQVISGSATALVVYAGKETVFGKVSERLKLRPEETEFERGVRRFGYFLMEVTLAMVVAIFAINVYLERHVLDSFLFSLALAVGLTPQLLPAIISINLSHGAKRMAQSKVIVKRLTAIENFGSMNVLCSDKTGTLTEGIVRVQSTCNVDGAPSDKVFLYAYLNAFYETGFANPIDEAVRAHQRIDVSEYEKLGELPYDFLRKRLSVLVSHHGERVLITKGALQNVLSVCSSLESPQGPLVDIATARERIEKQFEEFSSKGYRTLGVAYKALASDARASKDQEVGMVFLGFLVLYDPLKSNIVQTVNNLKNLGVALKIITGDNRFVAANVSQQLGLSNTVPLTGQDVHQLSDAALLHRVAETVIFAEIEPNQKERLILALRKAGNVVGYVGDGINDASALHAADVGISVDSAASVAKEAADIVLLEKDLEVLVQGVREGRATFANTLKYVFMATSANFGNMFSLAGISLVLPFLPLHPKQILLTNLLTDFPEMTIATDHVDQEMVEYPRRWDIQAIRKFMLTFGIISSLFDYATFAVLLLVLHATKTQFRTGWFVESVGSAALIVLVIRSRRPFFKSRPGRYLLIATLTILAVTFLLPYTPLGAVFGFEPLPLLFVLLIVLIIAFYVVAAELTKKVFYKLVKI